MRHHVHFHAGGDGLTRGRGGIERDAVIDQLHHGGVVADDEAVEAPLAAQHLRQKEWIRACRHAIEGVEGAHHGGRAGLDCSMVGRQIDLAERDLRHVGGVVLAAGLSGAVSGKVFYRSSYAAGLGEIIPLVAADVGTGHGRAQVGVFACALRGAAPARVAADVYHG